MQNIVAIMAFITCLCAVGRPLWPIYLQHTMLNQLASHTSVRNSLFMTNCHGNRQEIAVFLISYMQQVFDWYMVLAFSIFASHNYIILFSFQPIYCSLLP